jgi:acetylornithine deacetylase
MNNTKELYKEAVQLLKQLIAIPSFSKEEQGTARLLHSFFQQKGIEAKRLMNNVWVKNLHFDTAKPTLLLNSHHDTVKPNSTYTKDPFHPLVEDGKLYGLGSNDAGGCLVSLLSAFIYYYNKKDLNYNLILAASAEEEISGRDGIEALLSHIGQIDAAIVGEPTAMNMAIAEKGLLVVDCIVHGKAGHAAREEGENAIYKAIKDIEWFRNYRFEKESAILGPVKMNVTMVHAGTQHNVVPAQCSFTVDIRVNEHYTHEAIVNTIRQHVSCVVTPRSMRLRSTMIDGEHPLVKAGIHLGMKTFGSATLSDKALMQFPALKLGPGESARSHTADEYIYLNEIEEGIDIYINILKQLL